MHSWGEIHTHEEGIIYNVFINHQIYFRLKATWEIKVSKTLDVSRPKCSTGREWKGLGAFGKAPWKRSDLSIPL